MSDLLAGWPADAPPTRALTGAFLHADVAGFTTLAERLAGLGRVGAELLDVAITHVLRGFVDAARRWGGDVLSFGGDAILVHFDGERAVARATVAALEMQRAVAVPVPAGGFGPLALPASIGIHAGTATALRVTTRTQVEAVVVGPTITRTLQVEEHAPPGGVLVTDEAAAGLPPGWRRVPTPHGMLVTNGPVAPGLVPARPSLRRAVLPVAELLPPAVAGVLGTRRPPRTFRRVAVGFVRAAGMDGLATQDGPQGALDRLTDVLATLCEAADQAGAHVLTVDAHPDAVAVLVCAGAPATTGDDEAALLDTLEATIRGLPERAVAAGAHAGVAYAGDLGAPSRRSYSVLGDTVNVAARLMQRAEVGELLVTDEFAADADADRTPPAPVRVKGKTAEVHACRVRAGRSVDPGRRATAPLAAGA